MRMPARPCSPSRLRLGGCIGAEVLTHASLGFLILSTVLYTPKPYYASYILVVYEGPDIMMKRSNLPVDPYSPSWSPNTLTLLNPT